MKPKCDVTFLQFLGLRFLSREPGFQLRIVITSVHFSQLLAVSCHTFLEGELLSQYQGSFVGFSCEIHPRDLSL